MDFIKKILFVSLFLIVLLTGLFVFFDGLPAFKKIIFYKNDLRFSNTQKWDSEIYSMIKDGTFFVGDPFVDGKEFPPPPENLSLQTKREIEELKNLAMKIDEDKEKEIFLEINTTTMKMGPYFYSDFTESRKPYTKALFDLFMPEFFSILIKYKEKFDRVRPSFLDKDIVPSVGVPGHPSYPSGHASQTFLVAKMASELDPKNKEAYIQSAFRIGKNREIAGVHYESDSIAGRLLAEEYLKLLFEDERFLSALELAKQEW